MEWLIRFYLSLWNQFNSSHTTQALSFLLVWHVSDCSDHDKDPKQRQVHETYERSGNHREQVMHSSRPLVFLFFFTFISAALALFCQGDEVTVFFSLPAYIVTWWSIWMLRLFSKRSVTSTWRWTGYAPHSFTSEPSRTPHTMVRAQNRDGSQQLFPLFVLDYNLWVHSDFRFPPQLGQMWNWSKIARWVMFK